MTLVSLLLGQGTFRNYLKKKSTERNETDKNTLEIRTSISCFGRMRYLFDVLMFAWVKLPKQQGSDIKKGLSCRLGQVLSHASYITGRWKCCSRCFSYSVHSPVPTSVNCGPQDRIESPIWFSGSGICLLIEGLNSGCDSDWKFAGDTGCRK